MFIERFWHRFQSKVRRSLFPKPFDQAILKWIADNGDETHRLLYSLDNDSVVFDLGGYHGNWAAEIYARYRSNIFVFEPVSTFYEHMRSRFLFNPDINVFPFGLGSESRSVLISLDEDSSGIYSVGNNKERVSIESIYDFCNHQRIDHINLLKINIEGGEYELLESLIKTGFINRIDDLQIQFHDVAVDSFRRMEVIQSALGDTHELTYQYSPFVWENWSRRRCSVS